MKDSKLVAVAMNLVAHLRTVLDIETLRDILGTDHVVGGKLLLELPNGDIHTLDISLINDILVDDSNEEE